MTNQFSLTSVLNRHWRSYATSVAVEMQTIFFLGVVAAGVDGFIPFVWILPMLEHHGHVDGVICVEDPLMIYKISW